MRADAVEAVLSGLKKAGVSIATYLPDSLLKELYPALDADPDIRTIPVTNEGEGAALAGGVFLSGKRAVLVMENSGLRAATEHLARLGLGACLALAAAGAAAQTAATGITTDANLKEVVVTDQAEAIGGLQKTYAGGQFARGGHSLTMTGTAR